MGNLVDLLSRSDWPTLMTLVFSAVVAWAAVINTRLSTRLAEAELHPAISVYLEVDKARRWYFDLVVRNSGRGIARNVRFRVDPNIPVELDDPESRLTRIAFIREGLGHLGSGQEIRSTLNSFPAMVKTPIEITVSYEHDKTGIRPKRFESRFVLDVREFEGISSIGAEPIAEMADSIKQIAGDLRNIKQGGSFANVTITVKRRHFFSGWMNKQARRWSGLPRRSRGLPPLDHFLDEVKKSLSRRL